MALIEARIEITRRQERNYANIMAPCEISVLTLARYLLDTAPHYLKRLEPWRAVPVLSKRAAFAFAAKPRDLPSERHGEIRKKCKAISAR